MLGCSACRVRDVGAWATRTNGSGIHNRGGIGVVQQHGPRPLLRSTGALLGDRIGHIRAHAFNPFDSNHGARRRRTDDFSRVFEEDPFNPDDAWGASRTNNVRPFFNFNKHAGQWTAEDDAHQTPHESDFWYFNGASRASGAARGQKTYYYHEYNHHYHHAKYASDGAGPSGRSNRSSVNSQYLGRPDLQMARHAVENARQAVACGTDIGRSEGIIRREITCAMQYCALDVVMFARALDCDASSVRCAKRAIAMRYHPDKIPCVMEGDTEADKARKRLEGTLGHEILSALNSL
jgi:hypothetical protein